MRVAAATASCLARACRASELPVHAGGARGPRESAEQPLDGPGSPGAHVRVPQVRASLRGAAVSGWCDPLLCSHSVARQQLQYPGQQVARAPLSSTRSCSRTSISFFELLLFCRDFDIVPTLMSKQELTCVWKKCLILNHHNAVVGIDHVVEHSFGLAEFLQLVACIALVAFGARSHAKPAPEAAIDALVEYLRLDSPLHARKIIQTRGRETQARTDEIRARATLLHPHTAPPLVSGASDVSTFDPAASATS